MDKPLVLIQTIFRLSRKLPQSASNPFEKLWSKYERQFLNEQDCLNQMLLNMYKTDPSGAVEFAGKYSTGIAYQMVGIANRERDKLMTKITQESKYSLRSAAKH